MITRNPWDSDTMMSNFMEAHAEDFELWCTENGIHHDYAMDHEMDYLEANSEKFEDWAFNNWPEPEYNPEDHDG